jgi:hypothetical protein
MLELNPSKVTSPMSFDSPIPSTTTDATIQLVHLLREVAVLKMRITAARSAPRMPRKSWQIVQVVRHHDQARHL